MKDRSQSRQTMEEKIGRGNETTVAAKMRTLLSDVRSSRLSGERMSTSFDRHQIVTVASFIRQFWTTLNPVILFAGFMFKALWRGPSCV